MTIPIPQQPETSFSVQIMRTPLDASFETLWRNRMSQYEGLVNHGLTVKEFARTAFLEGANTALGDALKGLRKPVNHRNRASKD